MNNPEKLWTVSPAVRISHSVAIAASSRSLLGTSNTKGQSRPQRPVTGENHTGATHNAHGLDKMCNTPPSPKIRNPRLRSADCHEARQGGVPIFLCCHACATDLPLEDTESTRDLPGGLEQECRRGAGGHSMCPHPYFPPLTKTLGKLKTGLWGTELLVVAAPQGHDFLRCFPSLWDSFILNLGCTSYSAGDENWEISVILHCAKLDVFVYDGLLTREPIQKKL